MHLRVEQLSFSYLNDPTIQDISLHVNAGEFVGLIGPNGSGKSTVLKNLYRALTPEKGTASLHEKNLFSLSAKESAQQIGVVGQENELLFSFTVEEIVSMGRSPYKKLFDFDTQEDKEIVHHALTHLGIEDMASRNFLQLSGGEKQRVLIARVIAQETDFLLLDEVANHLDVNYQIQILDLVKRLKTSVLAVMHDLNMAALYCDRLYVLDKGKVVCEGTPEEVLTPTLLLDIFSVEADVSIHPKTGKLSITYLPKYLS